MIVKACPHCGTAFEPANGKQRYCRKKCHMEANRDREAKRAAAYYAANRPRTIKRHRLAAENIAMAMATV